MLVVEKYFLPINAKAFVLSIYNINSGNIKFNSDHYLSHICYLMKKQIKVKRLEGSPYAI